MAEYISKEAVLMQLMQDGCSAKNLQTIMDMPAEDVAPVVHCKDCKHSYVSIDARCCSYGAFYDVAVPDDFFCAYGVKKTGGE